MASAHGVALTHGIVNFSRRPFQERRHRGDIPANHAAAENRFSFGEVHRKVQLINIHGQFFHFVQNEPSLAADVLARQNFWVAPLDLRENSLLAAKKKSRVVMWPHHTGSGIDHADSIGASLDLRLRVGKGDFRCKLQQIVHKGRIIHKIRHDAVQTAEFSPECEGAFNPADD